MAQGEDRLGQVGGIAFVASGFLFLAKSVLELRMGPPPPQGDDILAWIASNKVLLQIVSEVFFFAVMALVPAVIALYVRLAPAHRVGAAVACGSIAATIPLLLVLLVLHGRLAFPVFHLQVHTPAVAELVVMTYFGGLHAVALVFVLVSVVLGVTLRREPNGKGAAYLGFVTAVFDLIGGYPDAVGPMLTFVSGLFFAAWLVALGSWLYRASRGQRSAHERDDLFRFESRSMIPR